MNHDRSSFAETASEIITAATPALMVLVAGSAAVAICYAPVPTETKAIALGIPIALSGGASGVLQNRKPDFSVKQKDDGLQIQSPGDRGE